MVKERFEKVRQQMEEQGISQLVVTSAPDLFYFLGKWIHSGERLVALYVNTKGDTKLILNEIIMNPKEFKEIEVLSYKDGVDPMTMLMDLLTEGILGIDKNWPAHFLLELMERNPKLKVANSSRVVDSLRMIKEPGEIEKLVEASAVVDKVMGDFIPLITRKLSEKEGAVKLKELFAKYGTSEFSFDPIIAYGAHAADPHHGTSASFPKLGDTIIIDIGGITNSYCSDTTRTVFYGEPQVEAMKIYQIVRKANETAIAMVKPGVRFCDVDAAARKVIEDAGYGEYFTHRTGHSVGIEVHEPPSVSAQNEMELQAGMVFSIEPGIYIGGKYGVRIEDLVVVTETGCRVLNQFSKEPIVL